MMSHLSLTRDAWTRSPFAALSLLALLAANAPGALANDASDGTYTWSAELVAFDEANSTVTVKSLVVSHADIDNWDDFAAGDRVMLTWSGLFRASGVRSITHDTEVEHDRLTMPVEFVASEMDGRYVTFTVPIPRSDAAKIGSLTPGTWVTATSPHQPPTRTAAVTAIRPFNDVS